jgi:hypothetical protein
MRLLETAAAVRQHLRRRQVFCPHRDRRNVRHGCRAMWSRPTTARGNDRGTQAFDILLRFLLYIRHIAVANPAAPGMKRPPPHPAQRRIEPYCRGMPNPA